MEMFRLKIIAVLITAIFFVSQHSNAEQSPCHEQGSKSIELKLGEALLVESTEGTALIWFIKYGPQEGESIYKWRYHGNGKVTESSGDGKVFEKYDAIETSPDHYTLKNIQSQLAIHAESITVEWSYGLEDDSGWIYYDPAKMKVNKIKESRPNTYKF